ncbi:MAG: JAB domain-containing protein [Gracilimonas sp.]|uniref:JAB domain-containing protein n=1 Tax=Gracilimonas sp. TaxID=1974203 RepID=UPI0037539B7A|nr:JAB domain-containing protein [Gracilimonas sp.]
MQTVAEVSLKYSSQKSYDEMPTITSPEEAAEFLRGIFDPDTIELREEFYVVLLSNTKQVLGWSKIAIGTMTGALVQPSTVFQVAILGNANSILVAHNHPSGNLKASSADIQLSKRLRDSGKLLGIQVVDSVILTKESYTSMMELGLI